MASSSPVTRRQRPVVSTFPRRVRSAWVEGMGWGAEIRAELRAEQKPVLLAVSYVCRPLHYLVHSVRALYLAVTRAP